MRKRKVLVLADAPMVATGFAQVTRNLLKELYDSGKYEIDMIGINYDGVFDKEKFEKEFYYLNRLVPAKQQNSSDMFGRELLLHILTGRRTELRPPWDILFTIQDHFILEAKSAKGGHKFSQTVREIKKSIMDSEELRENHFMWIGYWPVDSVLKPNWVSDGIALSDYPVAYCKYGRDEILKFANDENKLAERLKVVSHGTNTDDFFPMEDKKNELRKKYFKELVKDDTFLIINVNRNQVRKDLARTMLAYKEFKKTVPNSFLYLHCHTVDAGGNINDIGISCGLGQDDFGTPQGLDTKIGVPITTLNELYNCADVVMTTTLGEGWGLSITEAMAVKKPIVAPNITSIPELLNTEDGFDPDKSRGFPIKSGSTPTEHVMIGPDDYERLRPITNVEDAAKQLLFVYENPDIVKRVTDRAYEWAKQLTWKSENEKWLKIFDEACKVNDHFRENGLVDATKKASRAIAKQKRLTRNDKCPCGSKKKYKKCCLLD